MLPSVQRKAAIRIASAYRTTSTEALLVMARTPLIHLLVEERKLVQNGGTQKETRDRIIVQ